MREIEAKITELKNHEETYNKFTRPVCAFITFEEEDAYIISQHYEIEYTFSGQLLPAKAHLLGEPLYFTEATEPMNILWENRHFTKADRVKRGFVATLFIFLLILISFSIIFTGKTISVKIQKTYPPVSCASLMDSYQSYAQDYAYKEWQEFYAPRNDDRKNYYLTGILQCFCDSQNKTKKGFSSDSTMYGAPHKPALPSAAICYEYGKDLETAYMLGQGVSQAIVVVNFILRLFIIKLIQYIGKDTESGQTLLITYGVFIVQFFNTAILLLLANANMSEQGAIGKLLSFGSIPDFDSLWFNDIGYSMIYAMAYNIFWPLIEFCVYFGLRFLYRHLDRGLLTCNPHKTKKTTIQQYVELYSGPVFFIHYKYSSILNITFVTFTYGFGLPLLFPLAAGALFVLFCVEKMMIYYSYREPPTYDAKMNTAVLGLMTWAPLLFLSFGYWMFSSNVLFGNDTYWFDQKSDVPKTGHVWYEVFTAEAYKVSPALPLIVVFWGLLLLIVFRNSLQTFLSRHTKWIRVGELELDEGLDNYFKTLDDHDRVWSIKEEENTRNVLGMNILLDETLEKLRSTKAGHRTLQGVHTYDILANPLYTDDFQYFSADLVDRQKYIIDDDEDEENDNAQSDLVRVVLNLAFLSEEEAKNFSFDKKQYAKQVKGITDKIGKGFSINTFNKIV